MKKVIAAVLCLAVLFTLSVSAFAVGDSVQGDGTQHKVIMRRGIGVSGFSSGNSTTVVEDGETIIAKADPNEGTFNNWSVYKADGTPATEGTDYTLADGTKLTDTQVSVIAKTDIILCANYNGVKTDPQPEGSSNTSPKTADMSVAYVVVMLAAAAAFMGAKKVYSK